MDTGLVPMMGDVAGAGAALAGLILVFMGATTAAFEGYDPPAQKLLKGKFQRRATLSLIGLFSALISTGVAISVRGGAPVCLAWVAIGALSISALAIAVAALNAAREIR